MQFIMNRTFTLTPLIANTFKLAKGVTPTPDLLGPLFFDLYPNEVLFSKEYVSSISVHIDALSSQR